MQGKVPAEGLWRNGVPVIAEAMLLAIVVTNGHNRVIGVYDSELLCRQDMREVRKLAPEVELKCVRRRTMRRPEGAGDT